MESRKIITYNSATHAQGTDFNLFLAIFYAFLFLTLFNFFQCCYMVTLNYHYNCCMIVICWEFSLIYFERVEECEGRQTFIVIFTLSFYLKTTACVDTGFYFIKMDVGMQRGSVNCPKSYG